MKKIYKLQRIVSKSCAPVTIKKKRNAISALLSQFPGRQEGEQISIPAHINIYIRLTPYNKVLLKKLTVAQLVKIPAFHETRRLITVFTTRNPASNLELTNKFHTHTALLKFSFHLSQAPSCRLFPSGLPTEIRHAFLIVH